MNTVLVLPPFQYLKQRMLPTQVRTRFKTQWLPILSKIQEGIRTVNIPSDLTEISSSFVDNTYEKATNHLKTHVCSFLWGNQKNVEEWTIGSWSACTSHSYIMKYGIESDRGNLPPETRYNAPHRKKRKINKVICG